MTILIELNVLRDTKLHRLGLVCNLIYIELGANPVWAIIVNLLVKHI